MVMERLRDVERMFGGAQTAEGLGVTAGVLASLLAREVEMDEGMRCSWIAPGEMEARMTWPDD